MPPHYNDSTHPAVPSSPVRMNERSTPFKSTFHAAAADHPQQHPSAASTGAGGATANVNTNGPYHHIPISPNQPSTATSNNIATAAAAAAVATNTTATATVTASADDILLEGTALKRKTYLSKQFWDERYFIFRSNHVLEYYKKKTDGVEECRGKFPISHRTGCEISDLHVRKHKNELIYCMKISFTQLDYDTAIIGTGNDTYFNNNHRTMDVNGKNNTDEADDDNSSIGNGSQNGIADAGSCTNSIDENYQHMSLDNAIHGSTTGSPQPNRAVLSPKKPMAGITKILASPFMHNRRSTSNGSSNKTPVSSMRSIDAESITYGSQQQKRTSGILRQRRPKSLSRRALSQSNIQVLPHNHSSSSSVGFQYVPDSVEIPTSHRTSIPPPIISATTKFRSTSFSGTDEVGATTQNHTYNNINNNNAAEAAVESSTIMSSVTPVISNHRRSTNTMNDNDEEQDEHELLKSEYITTQEKGKHKTKDMVVQSTKLAAAVGATVSLTVLTAGVGLMAGLIVLGVAGAAGGGGAAVNATWLRNTKGKRSTYEMIIAFYDYDIAKQWKSILDVALESDSVHKSTWGQLFTSDGRLARAALLPKLRQISNDTKLGQDGINHETQGKNSPFRRNAKWTLIEGGLLAIVGCGFQGLRIYREEQSSTIRRRLCPTLSGTPLPPSLPPPQLYASVDGKPCPPMKANVVLSTSPLDAFLCLMSHGRVESSKVENEFYIDDDEDDVFDSDHRISFEIVECIDEHTDVIRMIYRPMFLFPTWTNPRDFVLFRYWRLDSDGSYVVCYESMVHPKCPPIANYVRAEMHSVFHIAPQKKSIRRHKFKQSQPVDCLMTATVQVDPKGWVPTAQWSCLSNQAYGDAFSIYALLKLVDIRDAIDEDRFVTVTTDHPEKLSSQRQSLISTDNQFNASGTGIELSRSPINFPRILSDDMVLTRNASNDTNDDTLHEDYMDYDYTYAGNESIENFQLASRGMTRICARPPPLTRSMWAEPDSNSFRVRGVHYKHDRLKNNAGPSIGRLMCVDVVSVDKPLYSGFSLHPTERLQLALQNERELVAKGLESDLPPFIFVVNICLPGPPFYHGVYYYAVNDIRTINGMDGTPSSKLCQEFFFGDSDEFRDRTFKLIPQIVQGNFIVRKAVGSTPAIMGKKLRQLYVKNERYFEVILDCGSSPVATGVIRLSLGYAKSLVVDMGFLLEGDADEHLPERIFGCVRMKSIDFGPHLRHVVSLPVSGSGQPQETATEVNNSTF